MTSAILFAVSLALAAVFLLTAIVVATRYVSLRGKRIVTCPETNKAAAVELDALRAAANPPYKEKALRLATCSRWPEREDCGQECLRQVEFAPDGCLVHSLVAKWYEGKACAICAKPITSIATVGQRPALLDKDGWSVEWSEITPELLPEVFATHKPICWNCHIAESLRRRNPDRVVDRDASWNAYKAG